MSRDRRISGDPGKYFSETGSARKLEIWILFSDRDPNPRPNLGNCLRVELFDRTSADIKLGTGGTGKSPRVWFHLWRNLNSSENLDTRRFSDLQDSSLAVWQIRHLRMMMGNSRGKLIFQDGGWSPPTSEILAYDWGIPIWGFPPREISLTSSARIPMRKAYLPMHGNTWQKSENLP